MFTLCGKPRWVSQKQRDKRQIFLRSHIAFLVFHSKVKWKQILGPGGCGKLQIWALTPYLGVFKGSIRPGNSASAEPLPKYVPAAELWTFLGKKPWDTKTRDLCPHEKRRPHLLQVVPIHLWTDPPVWQDPGLWASFPAREQAGAPSPPHGSPGGSWSPARGCRAQGAKNKHNILSLRAEGGPPPSEVPGETAGPCVSLAMGAVAMETRRLHTSTDFNTLAVWKVTVQACQLGLIFTRLKVSNA